MPRMSKRKRAPVRLPSDNLTEKELEALNGKLEIYRLGEPMTWKEFKAMPVDLKVEYIQKIRKKFGAPDEHIAKMLGVTCRFFCKDINRIGLKCDHHTNDWDMDGFLAWAGMVEVDKKDEEPTCDVTNVVNVVTEIHGPIGEEELAAISNIHSCDHAEHFEEKRIHDAGPIAFAGNSMPVLAKTGNMSFNNNYADDILKTLKAILGNAKVNVSISWNIMEE